MSTSTPNRPAIPPRTAGGAPWSWWVGAAALVVVPGCAEAPSGAAGAGSPGAETEAVPAHEMVVQPVTWPAPAAVDGVALAALPPAAQAAVARATVPVLVVHRPAALAGTTIIAKPLWAALSTRFDGVTVSLSATRAAHRYRHLTAAKGRVSVRGQPAFVTQNTGIWSAAWVEGGVAYALEVECGHRPDPRCDDDRFVLELTGALGYVGGVGPGGSP